MEKVGIFFGYFEYITAIIITATNSKCMYIHAFFGPGCLLSNIGLGPFLNKYEVRPSGLAHLKPSRGDLEAA
jgi:hypothetical protein